MKSLIQQEAIDAFYGQPGYEVIDVESLLVAKSVEKVLARTPKVNNYKDMIALTQPADVLLLGSVESRIRRMKGLKKLPERLMAKLNPILQRSPFNSSKMVVDQTKLIGYGLRREGLRGKFPPRFPVGDYSFPYYARQFSNALILRHNDITPESARDAVQFMLDSKDTDYNNKQLIFSIFRRLTKEIIPVGRGVRLTEEDKNVYKNAKNTPLICSVIIAYAFRAAGLPITEKVNRINSVWPVDLLVSSHFTPIVHLQK